MSALLSVTCLCGALDQTVKAVTNNQYPISIALCHCDTCRHTSGVLCTSYCPIEAPLPLATDGPNGKASLLTAYTTSSPDTTTRYFCQTCGCHVFRSRQQQQQAAGDLFWEVATGVIVDEKILEYVGDDDGVAVAATSSSAPPPPRPVMEFTHHKHVDDTGDGGLAIWLPYVGDRVVGGRPTSNGSLPRAPPPIGLDSPTSRTVSAACHCGAVRFTVLPADHDSEVSRQPHSGFSDLLVPFAATDPAITANPNDVKWWIRPPAARDSNGSSALPDDAAPVFTRWLAGTCACRSCRLATGFEIQTWAFIPRRCIILSSGQPLKFDQTGKCIALQSLSAYQSSSGVERNFCSCCGATVFWHDAWRPDLIDVSVGLLRPEVGVGSRVEFLLDWCTTRVSFVEEATRGRSGLSALRGSSLANALEKGMKGE